jgi:pantetheine-phosphate adenylyltransferase
MKRIGFTSGSFDPVTDGHADVIARAARMVDTLVIGIGIHPGKSPLFSTEEKVDMLKTETVAIARKAGCRIEIITFDSLTVDAAKDAGASLIFRGLRDGTDFDYEMQMSGMNGTMAPGVLASQSACAPYHSDAGAPDRHDGRRCLAIRLARRAAAPQGKSGAQEGLTIHFLSQRGHMRGAISP